MDAFLDDKLYTKAEIESLKTKSNGGKRLVISYMSIGEAENYRYYWKNWKVGSPSFVDKQNPEWKGNFKVKPQYFSFFDIQSKAYKTISSEAINLDVLQGENQANVTSGSKSKITEKFHKTESTSGFEFTFLHYIGSLILVGLALLFVTLKRNKSTAAEVEITEIKHEKKEFSVNDMQQFITNKELFYQEMELKINAFLQYKFGLEKADLNKENIILKFQANNISQENTNDFIGLLQNCEKARYMPTSDGNMQKDFEKLEQLVKIING